jgi:acetyl/propionyl-CoA carboxylase alpha subunit/acetyl-CoA carboxylase carboxyltransferase component
MPLTSVLVANRGEIAVRILRTATDMGLRTTAIYSEDDAMALHTRMADQAVALRGEGAPAYLDMAQVVEAARESGCDAIHPGYGFLSEQAGFAAACEDAGITFVGPSSGLLALLGNKVAAREAARAAGVPVLPGTEGETSVEEAEQFLASLDGAPMILKAVAGGGGRGVRVVRTVEELRSSYPRAASEAHAAFGNGALYCERLIERARHIEVQIVGDGAGGVCHLWERDCSLQRRHQKIVEFAPAPGLPAGLRDRIISAAERMARHIRYRNAGTFEFLVDAGAPLTDATPFFFIEANARLQVEHTVTEEILGIDLVRIQLELAAGKSLADVGLSAPPAPRGFAVQARVNMERMTSTGLAYPTGGTLAAFEPPAGPSIRVDTFGYAGYATSPRFDSLLAKVIVHGDTEAVVLARTRRALAEFRIEGVETNIPFLEALLGHPDVVAANTSTRFIDEHAAALVEAAGEGRPRRFVPVSPQGGGAGAPAQPAAGPRIAGAKVDAVDPLAVLSYGKAAERPARKQAAATPSTEGLALLEAPLQGTVVSISAEVGDTVRAGQTLVIMESMKMEHEINAAVGGTVRQVAVSAGDTIYAGQLLVAIEEAEAGSAEAAAEEEVDLDEIRPDLAEVLERKLKTLDEGRPQAVERRRKTGNLTARENVANLCDPGTFVEYGGLTLAAQRARRTVEDLIVRSPADGLITGVGSVNGAIFGDPESRCAVMAYDYTVFAGTQGAQNHRKTDRIIDVAEEGRMPFILFAEGGGGRPGDTDGVGGSGQRTFSRFAQLSGLVPMIGITTGRCFAGNASLLGCCDVIIATEGSNIGMGGPAMIEGGGLGIYAPEDIGPMDVQVPSGVVDIAVKDEAEAVEVAKKYLSYFQGRTTGWKDHDQRLMRRIVPENRLRVYDIRKVIETLADEDSVLELRKGFGHGAVTSLARIEGRPFGIIANNPAHLGGAIDSDAADKAARFMQLCDAFDLPILYLCDTPGIMVGPEIEATALVRHSSRMFVIGANLDVPFFTVIIRKAYGLGAIAMAGGSYKVPYFTVSWPTGEFGGMGLEGSVKLGYRDELAAIEDPEARKKRFDEMVARAYQGGKALNQAAYFAIDDTIDPADTRWWLANMLASIRPPVPRTGKKRPGIDAW